MRILTLSYEFPPIGGGGARVVYGLAREMVRQGHEVDLVTMGFRNLPRREVVDGINVFRVPCVRRSEAICHPHEMATYIAAAIPAALRLARERAYDVNHTHFLFPDGVVARALRAAVGLPYLVTTHGSDVPGYNPDRFEIHHRLLKPVWRVVTAGAARIVCPSESLLRLVRESGYGPMPTVIPNGIRENRFRADRPKERRILVVTRLVARKGVQHVLEAVRNLSADFEVAIVGDGPLLPTLRERARGIPARVTFHGWIDNASEEMRELYETSRIFVLASEAENFPISLLEAMSAGAAIVTTRGTGCAEVVGDTAVLVDSGNVDQLRSAFRELLADPERCHDLGTAARMRIDARFTWPQVARRYAGVYAEVSASAMQGEVALDVEPQVR